jgi:hypothetical protein
VVLRFFFTVELLPLFAEMFGRFRLNRARQSDHENRGRHFRLGADYDRIRDLFGCSVYALGILSPRARSCDGGRRPCAQTRLVSALHTDELKIAAVLSDAEPLQEELKDFQRQVSDAGRAAYNARVGAHDDLIAVAIAL